MELTGIAYHSGNYRNLTEKRLIDPYGKEEPGEKYACLSKSAAVLFQTGRSCV